MTRSRVWTFGLVMAVVGLISLLGYFSGFVSCNGIGCELVLSALIVGWLVMGTILMILSKE